MHSMSDRRRSMDTLARRGARAPPRPGATPSAGSMVFGWRMSGVRVSSSSIAMRCCLRRALARPVPLRANGSRGAPPAAGKSASAGRESQTSSRRRRRSERSDVLPATEPRVGSVSECTSWRALDSHWEVLEAPATAPAVRPAAAATAAATAACRGALPDASRSCAPSTCPLSFLSRSYSS